ncbi:MAG: galactose-1-phosphate uridylyltransferase [Actinobacteria bacterium]|nr:MAG: galactose-1-phosphate uridylyltransferase [Actinomycetota bacterium]
MSEIRKDPASHTWVVLATERKKRPSDFKGSSAVEEPTAEEVEHCPLCFGHEHMAPPAVFEMWPARASGRKRMTWTTRVVENKFPALNPGAMLSQEDVGKFFHYLTGVGGHEVIVDSPRHGDTLSTMPQAQLVALVKTYIQRYRFWRNDKRMAYTLIFKNYGAAAGASLSHPHSQLVAMPIIPPRVVEELEEAKDFYGRENACLYCRMAQTEMNAKPSRMVFENESMVAFAPYASRFPFELRILPKRHMAAFEEMRDPEIADFAEALGATRKSIARVLSRPPYNLMIHVAPIRTPGLLYYHWHVEVIPRLAMPAGFEWGSGIYINTMSPEEVAKALRNGGRRKRTPNITK